MFSTGRYQKLIPYALREWRRLLGIFLLTAAASAAATLQPWPVKLLVDFALASDWNSAWLPELLGRCGLPATPRALVVLAAATSLALFALNSSISVGLSLAWSVAGQRMVYDLAGDLFGKLQRLSLSFHSRRNVGDTLSRLTEDTWSIYSVADNLLLAPQQQVVTLIAMVGVGFALDPVLATIALAVAPLLALSSRFFGRRLRQRSKLGREASSRLMGFVHQTLSAMPVVQAFGTESRNTQRMRELADESVALAQRGNLLGSSYGLVNGLISTAGMAVLLYCGAVRVLSGAIPLGTLLVFLAYVKEMQKSSGGLFAVFAKLKAAEASVDRILEVMQSDDMIHDPPHATPLPARPRGQRGHVRLDGVTFGYDSDQPALEQVTLEACPGEVMALVGPTGAGKSTLVSLIPRFFDPWEGTVRFDGVDVRQLKVAELRRQISIVLQDPFLMPISVADNIAYGRPGASRGEVMRAAEAAQADEFIRRLPRGYDTVLSERGATLSGGERQRLSMARALLKDAPVLILDEPTSALDAQTEAYLIAALRRLLAGRTTFIIAHRPTTIQFADRIALLDHGRVIDVGSHRELMGRDGPYRRLFQTPCSTPPCEADTCDIGG